MLDRKKALEFVSSILRKERVEEGEKVYDINEPLSLLEANIIAVELRRATGVFMIAVGGTTTIGSIFDQVDEQLG